MKRNQGIARILILSGVVWLLQCSSKQNEGFLGSAVMEANTYQIATTSQGTLVAVYKDEGDAVRRSELLAVVDTIPYILSRDEIQTGMSELRTTIASKQVDIKAAESDLAGLRREYHRIQGLAEKGAVSTQQRDNLQTQFESAQLKLDAIKKNLQSLLDKQRGMQVQMSQIDDKIAHCYVTSPSNGTVLTRYRNLQEVVIPGGPIFEIGSFDTLYADFFIPQPVLASIKYGQKLRVRIDYDDGKSKDPRYADGIVTWINNEAEFSPKNIQTRESRNELVFRVRVDVPNVGGTLKRGQPVEIWR